MWTMVLFASMGSAVAFVTLGQESTDHFAPLRLSYQEFDQTLGGGWRAIADAGRELEAAQLIDRYAREKPDLVEWQRVALRFHSGQLYAFSGRNETAIARFQASLYDHEPPEIPIRWNAYVRATIAFLRQDRDHLIAERAEIAQGPKFEGKVANLDVVDRLVAHFGEPYSVAYRGKNSSNDSPR